jgi:hypothetical protein
MAYMNGVTRIERVIAQFEAWMDDSFPFAKVKIKVLEREPRNLLAVPNVTVRHLKTKEPEYISGIGETVEEAVSDLLIRFVASAREHSPPSGLTESDFEWSAPEDF